MSGRPRVVQVVFEPDQAGQPTQDMIILRTSTRRGTIINSGPWSNLRVNFDAVKPGRLIRALSSNNHLPRGMVIGGRVASVAPVKEW